MKKYDKKIIKPCVENSIFVLNSRWVTTEAWEANVPNHVLREIAEKKLKVYNIDATKIS
jgi:pyruvate-ferredoxin/flavodoxin oxidoreductase